MIRFVWDWFTARWPVYPLKHLLLDEDIPGGASFAYTLGAGILTVLTLQITSGILQLFYYVPTVDHAYDSVSYLRTQVPFGWLVHNMHYWGANIMIVLVALHMIRVYIWGGYKTQLTWLIGVGLLIMTMAMIFTGAPLIWDQKGYWAGEVGSSITGTAPVFGPIMKTILRGGESVGQLTLSRFFVIHIALITPVLLLLIGIHVAAFRTTGIVGPWSEEKRRSTGPFWPDQAFKDLVVATALIFIMITLCVFAPPAFTGPADPSNTTYIPKPEWNFLFLYQSLKYFKGPFEPVGTAGVPTVLIALLVLLPFIDRNPERNPMLRPIAMACLAAYAGLIMTLTLIGYLSPGYAQMPGSAVTSPASSGQRSPQSGGLPTKPAETDQKAAAAELPGARFFKSDGCIGCHSVYREGGKIGPELSGPTLKGRDRKWLTEQLMDPKSHFPNTVMPSFSNLPEQHITGLVDYLLTLAGSPKEVVQDTVSGGDKTISGAAEKTASGGREAISSTTAAPGSPVQASGKQPGQAAYIIGDPENGAILFKQQCIPCHGQQGLGGVPNQGSDEANVPALNPVDADLFKSDPQVFAGNIDVYIQHGSTPHGNPSIKMPPFGDSHALTQQEIANIEAYILRLNKVDRAKLVSPGMKPFNFFMLAVVAFGLVALILGGIWNKKLKRR